MERESVKEIDDILGYKFKALDDGFIYVVDYMGSDNSICRAARVSYGAGTKSVSSDKNLIKYLMRHQHWSPFEMPEIMFHVRVPMDCWRQWIRHRMSSVNEYSTRYSEAISSMQSTPFDEWRSQSQNNKQGSDGFLNDYTGALLSARERTFHEEALDLYKFRLMNGVAREQARKDLPLSTYTEAYWKIDLRNLLNFLKLRTDMHAQKEIREYANIILENIIKYWVPNVYEAFIEYIKESIVLTKSDIDVIFLMNKSQDPKSEVLEYIVNKNLLTKSDDKYKKTRELMEMEIKLNSLGYDILNFYSELIK